MADWLERFVEDGTIGESQLEEARQMAASLGITPEDALVRQGYINGSDLGRAQAAVFNYEFMELEGVQIPNSIIEQISESVARDNVVIAVGNEGDAVVVAMHNPNNMDVLDKLRFLLNKDVKVVMATMESIQGAINRHYGQTETESVDTMISEFTEKTIEFS
ncbi:MAG: type II/IV secretion system protein, partial [Planctomycetaceae bacterium]|nr:type II/IV secretion system protein [Planctomycetaceae bacterium]